MKPDAAKLTNSSGIRDTNYIKAMQLLQEHYGTKRGIVQAHMQIIWSQPSMEMESSYGLRKIWESTNEQLRVLIDLVQPVSFLASRPNEKIDIDSKKQWQSDHPGPYLLTSAELAKILDTRRRTLETGPVVHGSFPNPTNQPPRK